MMGRTHGVHAEPTTFGLKLGLWYEEMKRNLERFKQAARQELNTEKFLEQLEHMQILIHLLKSMFVKN